MQALARAARGILPATAAAPAARVQQARGIVVYVKDGNLERAGGNGAQDAVERHREADPGPEPDPPPRQGLGEAGARPQGPHAARPLPGARQEAPRHPHQEDQGPVSAYFMRWQEDYRYSMVILIHTQR